MDAYPKVIVITVNWNGKKWLGDCLISLLKMNYPNYDVVVVDNGSTDSSVDFIKEKFPRVHLIEIGRNLGFGGGSNVGLEYALSKGATYSLLVNNDTVIDANALTALVDTAISQPKAGFVTGKVFYYDYPDRIQTVGKKEDPLRLSGDHIGSDEKDIGQYNTLQEREFIDHACTLVDCRMYEQTGGYDPQYFLNCEEIDWEVRSKKEGWKLYYTPDARIWHHVSRSMGGGQNPIGEYFLARNYIVLLAKHAGLLRFSRYYILAGFTTIDSLVRGLLQFDRQKIKIRFSKWLGFLAGTLWVVRRQPAQKIPTIIARLSRRR